MKTPRTIRVSNVKRKHKRKINTKKNRSRKSILLHNAIKHNETKRIKKNRKFKKNKKKQNKTQKGGTSVLPTALVNIYDSIIYGIFNFANVLQGVEETVSPLPYLDHF